MNYFKGDAGTAAGTEMPCNIEMTDVDSEVRRDSPLSKRRSLLNSSIYNITVVFFFFWHYDSKMKDAPEAREEKPFAPFRRVFQKQSFVWRWYSTFEHKIGV